MNTRRKRSLDTSNSSPMYPLGRRIEDNSTNNLSKEIHAISTPKEITTSLLQRCMETLSEGIWWRILPLDDGYDDISVGMGIDWGDLLPLLIHHGLLYSTKRSTACDYLLSHNLWQSFTETSQGKLQMGRYSNYNMIGGKRKMSRQYFICNGKPICKSPTQQLKELKNGNYNYLRVRYAGSLKREVSSHATDLTHALYMSRCDNDTTTTTNNNNNNNNTDTTPIASNTTPVNHKIDFTFTFNFERRPRMDRNGDEEIKVHDRKQALETEKAYALLTAKQWGWQDNSLHSKQRMKIARAVCRQVAFDNGYKKPFSASQLRFWDEKVTKAIDDGTSPNPLSSKHRGTVGYCEGIKEKYPGYLREMFRYAQRILGSRASYKALAETMNWKSDVPGEIRPSLSLHEEQVWLWFISEGGKEYSPIEKPLDTDEHKQKHLEWVKEVWDRYTDPNCPVCHLDEKWFYITSRRKKIKRLPLGNGEVDGSDFTPSPKMRSRRYPVKCMFLGCVANPSPDNNFDGRIHLERISKQKTTGQTTHHSRFSEDVNINNQMKNGEWRNYIDLNDTQLTIREHAVTIGIAFQLEDAIVDRLSFYYQTYTGEKGLKKNVYLDKDEPMIGGYRRRHHENKNVLPIDVIHEDIFIKVKVEKGEIIEVDCSCDSEYMLAAMDRVGKAIRLAFHWIPKEQLCYLNIDNAGGHGTKVAVAAYTKLLKDKYNVVIIHQVPRSPYTNLLDLGVWCSLQSHVEKEHYMKRTDVHALVSSVGRVWRNASLTDTIGRVWGRLRNVLVLIQEDGGGNNLVETKRGKKFRNLDLPADFLRTIPSTPTTNVATTPVTTYLDLEDDDSDDEDEEMFMPSHLRARKL